MPKPAINPVILGQQLFLSISSGQKPLSNRVFLDSSLQLARKKQRRVISSVSFHSLFIDLFGRSRVGDDCMLAELLYFMSRAVERVLKLHFLSVGFKVISQCLQMHGGLGNPSLITRE